MCPGWVWAATLRGFPVPRSPHSPRDHVHGATDSKLDRRVPRLGEERQASTAMSRQQSRNACYRKWISICDSFCTAGLGVR